MGICGKSTQKHSIELFAAFFQIHQVLEVPMEKVTLKRTLWNCGNGCPFPRIHAVGVSVATTSVSSFEKGGDNHVGGYDS